VGIVLVGVVHLVAPAILARGSFWKKLATQKEQKDPTDGVKKIVSLLRKAHRTKTDAKRKTLTRKAATIAHKLCAQHPASADLHYWKGYALYNLKKYKTALTALKKAQKLKPNPKYLSDIGFKMGIIYTTLHRFQKAFDAYKAALQHTADRNVRGIIYSNAAETIMAAGKIQQAILFYRRALQANPGKNSQALWGLAVALDRDQQIIKARRAARAAWRLDPNLKHIEGPGVFFVPRGEKHYYLALAHEVGGHLNQALHHWQRFVKILPNSPWRYQAQRHLKNLTALRKKATLHIRAASNHAGRVNGKMVKRSVLAPSVKQISPWVLACYKTWSNNNRTAAGMLELIVETNKRTIVESLSLGKTTAAPLKDDKLESCLKAKFKRKALRTGKLPKAPKHRLQIYLDIYFKW
jgi:tetratricopeptide (TPR) repeat protein